MKKIFFLNRVKVLPHHPKKERNCSFTNSSLWLSAKDTKKLNIAANLFLNVYSYGYSAIDNTHNFAYEYFKENQN